MSNYLQSHGLQDTRLPCPSLSPGVCSNSCLLSWWPSNHLSSATAFFCLQSFPASRSFSMSQLSTSGGQSTGALASVLSMSIQGWFPLGLTGLISFLSKRLSRVFSSIANWKHQLFSAQPSLWFNFHICIWLLDTFDYPNLCWQSDVSTFLIAV